MAKDKQGQPIKAKRGEAGEARTLFRKAQRVAKSQGRNALEAYVASHTALKVYFAKDIARLVATTWTPKVKSKVAATTA